MNPRSPAKLFSWRSAFTSKLGPKDSSTRLVLLTLSLFMDETGGSCYPSQQRISDASGLTKPTVIDHLERAERGGWIIRRERSPGKIRGGHSYQAAIPDHVLTAQAEIGKTTSPMHGAIGKAGLPIVEDGAAIGKTDHAIGKTDQHIGKTDAPKLVKPLYPNSVVNSSENSSRGSEVSRSNEQQPKPIQHEDVPASAWVRPDGSVVPESERPALLKEARELVRTGKSDNLTGGVRYALARQQNERKRSGNGAGRYTLDDYVSYEDSQHPVLVTERHERQKERERQQHQPKPERIYT